MSIKKAITDALEKAGHSVASIKLALSSIKLEDMPPPPAEPAAKNEVKLKDGSSIMVEGEIKEGATVSVITPEGAIVPMDGDYESEDGTIYSVTGGLIVTITAPKAQGTEKTPDPLQALMTKVAALETEFAGLKTSLAAANTANTALSTELATVKAATNTALSAVEAIASVDSSAPTQPVKAWEQMSALEKRNHNKSK